MVLTAAQTLEYREEPREVFFRPSVDIFFDSVVEHWPRTGVAALLTGMGRDGARGLKALRTAGWHTIAQNESSSVVWSMPKAAIEIEAAAEILPIGEMGRAIATRLSV